MKMSEAIEIMNNSPKGKLDGYMVSFEKREGGVLRSDYFPDKHAGEELIKTEEEAWRLARLFASSTDDSIVNIYVVGSDFIPVAGYSEKKLKALWRN
jgi:hypothetical protein